MRTELKDDTLTVKRLVAGNDGSGNNRQRMMLTNLWDDYATRKRHTVNGLTYRVNG